MAPSRVGPGFPSLALGWGCGLRFMALQTGFSCSGGWGGRENPRFVHRLHLDNLAHPPSSPCLPRAPWESNALSPLWSDLWFAKHFHTILHLCLSCVKCRQGTYYHYHFADRKQALRDKVICSRINRCQFGSDPASNSKFSTFSFLLLI